MQARFLLGPAGSGKTFRCLAEIRAALRDNPAGPPLILLAPKQATFQLERQLLAGPALAGYSRLRIFSFERLAQFVLDELDVTPPRFLSEEGRVMVLRALLLRHADELKLFRGSARRPGFAQELGRLLNELQQHQITSAKLRALLPNPGLRRELHDKLHDLALLLDAYAAWLETHELQDGNHLLEAATSVLCQTTPRPQLSSLKCSGLWLDGFAEMTPQELDLLAAVIPNCERATLAFCLEESAATQAETSWLSIWSAVGQSFQQCRERLQALPDYGIQIDPLKRDAVKSRFAASPALQKLEQRWQSGAGIALAKPGAGEPSALHSIRLVACPDADAEAALAARAILKFVRDGHRFRDCAVLVRHLDGHHKSLERAFRRYEIPHFLDRRESVAHHPLAELTRSALRTVAFDWSHDDWFAALKAGFARATETEIDRLENESLARGWRGKKWWEPIQIADDPELEKFLERLRQTVLPPFEKFAKQFARQKNTPNGPQLAEALQKLWADLDIESTLERWTLDEQESAIGNRQSAIHPTVWSQMNTWLDNVALAFANDALPLRDWLPILEAGLANLTVGVVPPALDQVLIGAIDRARNPDLKLAFVLGVNETMFPAAPVAPAILTDADRDELTLPLGPDLRQRLARERYYGYIACTRASEKLVVTFARQDAEGKTLNPSPFIAQLQNLFPELKIEEFKNEIEPADMQHANELAEPLVRLMTPHPDPLPSEGRGRTDATLSANPNRPPAEPTLTHQELAGGCSLSHRMGEGQGEGLSITLTQLLELPALKSLGESLRALREPLPTENLSPALAEKLFTATLRSSVSRLEEFAQCPFRFFVRSGLRADERRVFELDARERGSFQHDVLKEFHEQLQLESKRWRDITPGDARMRVGMICDTLAPGFRDGLLHDSAQTQFETRALTAALQDFIEVIVTWMRNQYEFDPVAVELGFGGKDALLPAWEIALAGGHKLALNGRIDRVDLWRDAAGETALAVVLDYKSSRKTLDKILVANGIQLQLPGYLAALRRLPGSQKLFRTKHLIPAGVFYVNLRGQYNSGGTRDEILADADEARRHAYRHTGRFDAGALAQLDRVQARDQFNYRLKNNGELYANSTEALPRAEFDKLLDGVEAQLRSLGESIFSGAARVDPYRKGKQTPCEYCDYQAACRIDKWTHQYRVLRVPESEAENRKSGEPS